MEDSSKSARSKMAPNALERKCINNYLREFAVPRLRLIYEVVFVEKINLQAVLLLWFGDVLMVLIARIISSLAWVKIK